MLGPSQSGYIASVGYEMYLQLMERTMRELKGEPPERDLEPEIVVNRSAYIPETYISDIDQRMVTYRRLAKMADTSEVENLVEELRDRFGPLPEPVKDLVQKILLKVLCKKIGVQRLELTDQAAVLTFHERTCVKPETITTLVQKDPGRFRLMPDHVLRAKAVSSGLTDPLEDTKKLLQELT